ncbi:hypothetical protein B7P43_G04091 [Cryptotermes secundus]|uniref:Uncharacterized protein n=3 Tax=Cryptotermes secundus TaxID=105785 RepID=A0A2J7R412_9NEOP|nr:mucin-5AC isoform X2 [Cryptotermes secundus]PNF35555.1 hypothetical protein B7P43_G04091 [Cryptotermes secundus]
MATLVSCYVLLLVVISCTASQWSKPLATDNRRLSTASEDWVPVASACPSCLKEAKSKVVARQAEPLLQPPPAYQLSAQSAYIQQTLSAQQREIQNHFNAPGLLPTFTHKPEQFFNQQHYLAQTGSAGQQLVSPQLSHQQPSIIQQLTPPQLSHQQISASKQLVSPQLSNPLQSSTQQLTFPQSIHQQTSAAQQLLSPLPNHQQTSAGQQVVSPQPSYQQIPATQVSKEQPSAAQQLAAPHLNHRHEKVPQRTRRPPTSTTVGPAPQEEVQLLYVPVETLRQQQQAAALLQQQQQLTQEHLKSSSTTEHPSTTLEPYQPPLSVYMGPKGHNIKISDVVKVLKDAKTISVLDTVGPDSPQVFVGPSDLHTPEGYAKFELPYLSALESNRVERKVNKPPFFVAPLSFTPPPGYSKIPFPAPHVGSVVVSNVTENVLHEKIHTRKHYSLPPQLPPINPELASLVNSLQDQRHVLLVPQKQEAQHVGLETSTERYTRKKQSRQPYQDTEVTTTSARLPNKQTRHRFQQPSTQYQPVTVTTVQPQYLEKTRTRQPPYPEFEEQSKQSHHGLIQAEISTHKPQTAIRNPPRQPQYPEDTLSKEEYTKSQVHAYKTSPLSPQESLLRTLTPEYYNSQEESSTQQSQYVTSDATVPEKQAAYNVPPKEVQYPHLESVVITEQPTYTIPEGNIPTQQAKYTVTDTYVQPKYTTTRAEIPSRRPLNLEPYSGLPKYTTAQDISPQRETQYPVLESSTRPSQYETPVDVALRQPQHSELEKSAQRKPSIHMSQDYPVLETAAPVNTKYDIPKEQSPHREPQYTVLQVSAPAKSENYHTAQDILLRPESGDENIYKVSQHRFQYPSLDTANQQKTSKQTVTQEKVPSIQSQYQITKTAVTEKQPTYSTPQDIPSRDTQYTVSPETVQSQYPTLESEVLTDLILTTTTTAAPTRETPSRGRSRGRYRPSSSSTTTPAPRTRSPYSRGRRPVTRTTSETPDVPASADQINTFESSRQHPQKSQFETQRRDRTRTRSRGRSTTTTTVSPQYNRDLHQGDLYTPTTVAQHSRTDTVTENFLQFASVYQQQSPSGHVTHTQFPTGQPGFTQPPSSQLSQRHSGPIPQNQFSSSQVLNTHLPSGSNSGGKLTYIQIPNEQVSHSQIANEQGAFWQVPNRSESQQQISIGQTAHDEAPIHEVDYPQLHSGQSSHSQIQSEALNETQIQNAQIVRQHISSGQLSQSQVPNGHVVINQVPSENVRSTQLIREKAVYSQVPSSQSAVHKVPDYSDRQPVTSTGSKHLSSAPALSNIEVLQPDGIFLQELPVSTTQRQHSALPHTKHRTKEVSVVYQTTLPSQTLDGKYTGQGDPQLVTSNRGAKGQDGDVTEKPSFVRIRGRVRGRPRIVQQSGDQITTTATATPELQVTTVGRKQTNFLNRGSARKTQALTTTPPSETTTPFNDKVYTVRPSRRSQQSQTKLTTRARIRRPTRPPATTISTLTTPSDHRLNEVPDVFTTEVIPTARGIQISVQPQYDPVLQTQQKQQHHQSVEHYREPVQHYQPHEEYQAIQQHQVPVQQYQLDQHYQAIQRHQEPVQQHQLDQQYQAIQRHQEPVQQHQLDQHYHSIPQHQVPVQQYRPSEQYHQQHQSVEHLRVADQTSLPSGNQARYGANDPERGEESQWSTRTLVHNSSNVIPNVSKYSNTQLEVATEVSVTTEGADSTTGTIASTTEAAPLLLTTLPGFSTTTEISSPVHSRRRGNWIRVRVRPQKDIFETAESQNLATVAEANQIPGESTFKQVAKNTGDQDVLENYSPTSSSSHGSSETHDATKEMTESSSAIEVLGHQGVTLNFQNVPSGFMKDNITVGIETKSPNNDTVTTDKEEPSLSLDSHGYENLDGISKHAVHKDAPGVTGPSSNVNSSNEGTTEKDVTKSVRIQDDYDNTDFSSWLVPPSSLYDMWNQEGSSELVAKFSRNQDKKDNGDQIYKKANSSWTIPSSSLKDSLTQDPPRMTTDPLSNKHDDDYDDDDSITTVSPEEMTTLWPEEQDSYGGSLLSSKAYYGKSGKDSDRNLNWGGYEDWWAKTYANHRPYYTDEQLKLPEETEKQLPDSTSIWDMAGFREYEDSDDSTDDVSRITNTSLSRKTTQITENSTAPSTLEDYPSYQVWEDLHKYYQSNKHSVKKANPQNLYSDKQVKLKDAETEPEVSSIPDVLAASPEDTLPGTDIPTAGNDVDMRQFHKMSTEQSDQSLTESTTSAHSNLKGVPSHSPATEASILSTSTKFAVPSSAENILSTESIPDENIIGTDKTISSESKKTPYHNEYSSESSVPLTSESSIKRTDTQSLMARILGTTTSTKISHETEICYRGRCIKTKTKDSDIDQFSTD